MAFGDIDIPYFHEQGFVRKVCQVTNLWFWTRDPSRETSGDTTEDEYTFIGDTLFRHNQRGGAEGCNAKTFLSYFEEHSHSRIDPTRHCPMER